MNDGNQTARWVSEAKAGDTVAWDRLFVQSAPRLRLFLRVRMGAGLRTKLEPEDVLQDVYLEALRVFSRFEHRGTGSFVKWLCRIAENVLRGLVDHHGARKRRAPGDEERVSHVIGRLRDSNTGPLSAAARVDRHERLARAIESLPDEERVALLLKWFQGRSTDEVADTLGKSPATVRRLVGRAMLRIGDPLRRAEGVDDEPAG